MLRRGLQIHQFDVPLIELPVKQPSMVAAKGDDTAAVTMPVLVKCMMQFVATAVRLAKCLFNQELMRRLVNQSNQFIAIIVTDR